MHEFQRNKLLLKTNCMALCVVVVTIGGKSIGLSCLGVSGVDGRLLHAVELGLAGVCRHGRGCRRGEDVRVGPGKGEE